MTATAGKRRGSALTVTDLFCGAGGSSIGAEASGATLRMAANHWPLAIETHNTNFPEADHDCADVSQVDPRRYPSTDILLASPECTWHSSAKATKRHEPNLFDPHGDPAMERSRATMWDVPRFVERHRYEIVVVENVVEIMKWDPIDAWLLAMDSLGYEHRFLSLNSFVTRPTPQSRDRWYCVFWRKGNTAPDLDIRAAAWCPSCDANVEAVQVFKRPDKPWGKFRQQYVYSCPRCSTVTIPYATPALEAIDWTLPCPRIGDRPRPLADATLSRVQAGLDKLYGPGWVVETANSQDLDRGARSLLDALPTQTGRQTLGLAVPPSFILVNRTNNRTRSIDEPLAPVLTADHQGLVTLPFIAELRGGGSKKKVRPVTEALSTVTADGNHHGLVIPPAFFVKNFGTRPRDAQSMAKSIEDPLGTVTAVDHHSLVTLPFTVNYNGNGTSSPVDRPIPTVTTVDRHALVDPQVTVDDCGFRMLQPAEIGRAMAFPETYEVKGNKREKVRQYGGAVTPPVMTEIVRRCIESLA